LSSLNSAIAAYRNLLGTASAENASEAGLSDATAAALTSAAQTMVDAYYAYSGNQAPNSVDLAAVCTEMTAAGVENPVLQARTTAYADSAVGRSEAVGRQLADAQNSVSDPALGYSSFQELSNALNTAQSELDKAKTALDSAAAAVENAEKSVETAHDNYDTEKNSTTLTSQAQNVEDAKTRLESAKETPATLTNLQKTLEACTLTATSDGTITALTAVVGSVCGGSVATIQDVDRLVVEVTVPAGDVGSLTVGMPCRITSDATGEAVIDGTLTQLDPTASEQGGFGARVTVSGAATGLLVGIQAQVEIIRTSADNVFVVPLDAVGTGEDGSRYVLRCTGGTGTDMTFEQVPVTVGQSNDYYAEIAGDTLAEGDVIRSSADLTEGIASTGDAQEAQGMQGGFSLPGAGMAMGGEMGGGQRGERPAGTGGAPGGR
ncbi:MAG: efflux RND transporter periplasmic adaptor subunit, partial [Gemmiger sp.]